MRVFLRLLALAVGVVAVVAVIQAFNGAPWWVAIVWAALTLVLNFASNVTPPNKTVQLAHLISQGGLQKQPVATQVAEFLRRGANPNGLVGETRILNEATVWGELAVVETLLVHGADPNGRDSGGWAALHVAQNNDHQDVAQLLVDKGADVNGADNDGRTPLHMAASRGDANVVRWLIALGADPQARDNRGHTPLAEAEKSLSAWTSSSELSRDVRAVAEHQKTVWLLRSCTAY